MKRGDDLAHTTLKALGNQQIDPSRRSGTAYRTTQEQTGRDVAHTLIHTNTQGRNNADPTTMSELRRTNNREDEVRPVRSTTRSEQTTTKETTLCR